MLASQLGGRRGKRGGIEEVMLVGCRYGKVSVAREEETLCRRRGRHPSFAQTLGCRRREKGKRTEALLARCGVSAEGGEPFRLGGGRQSEKVPCDGGDLRTLCWVVIDVCWR